METLAAPPDQNPEPKPVRRDIQTRITKETSAKLLARRLELKAYRLANPPKPAEPDPPKADITDYLTNVEREELVCAYKKLCTASRKALETLTEPKDRHQEASTLAKLESALWRYAGIPGEGTLKPSAVKQDKRKPFRSEPE